MSVETVVSDSFTFNALLKCIIGDSQHCAYRLSEPFGIEGFPHRMLTSLRVYSYIFVPAVTIYILDCYSTSQINKFLSNKTIYVPELEHESFETIFSKHLPGPSFEGITRGYYNDLVTGIVYFYIMFIVCPIGLLVPDAWRRLAYTALMWFPVFFSTMKMLVSFTERHSILLNSRSRCNLRPAIFSCAPMRNFPRITEGMRIICAALVTTAALWYEMPAAQSVILMAIIHNESNLINHKRRIDPFSKLIFSGLYNLIPATIAVLWSVRRQGLVFPIRVCSKYDHVHTNWSFIIIGSMMLCVLFQSIFRFYMFGSSDLATKDAQDAEVNTSNHNFNYHKIYFFTSILAFFLSYVFIAMLEAISFLDGSTESGGYFIGCVASIFIPLSIHMVAVARGEDQKLWKYGVEWKKLDDDVADDRRSHV